MPSWHHNVFLLTYINIHCTYIEEYPHTRHIFREFLPKCMTQCLSSLIQPTRTLVFGIPANSEDIREPGFSSRSIPS